MPPDAAGRQAANLSLGALPMFGYAMNLTAPKTAMNRRANGPHQEDSP